MDENKEEQPEEPEKEIIIFKGEINKNKISVDLNIKKYSNYIFPHHRIKNLNKVRTFDVGEGKLTIRPATDIRPPTIYCFRVFLVLLALAKHQGLTSRRVYFTSRLMARILRTPMTGEFATRLVGYLTSLNETSFEWRKSFASMDGVKTRANFHLIDSFVHESYGERLEQKKQFDDCYSADLNEDIFKNLKDGKLSFANLTTLLKFNSGLSEVFYLYIDTILCSKHPSEKDEKRSETVINILQLDDVEEYRKVSKRKRILSTIQAECHGKQLSNGNLLKVELLPTADEKDWKLRCSQIQPEKESRIQKLPSPVNTDPDFIEYLADQITEATGQPENRRWHQMLAAQYPEPLIMRALSELRQEPPENMRDKGAVFTAKLKAIVTSAGHPWLKAEA
jgi:hypothetical protein